jgi:hypothetical protein
MPKIAQRSAVTGRQLGRSAIRAQNKNALAAENYLKAVEKAKDLTDLTYIEESGLSIGRVIKALGCGRLEIQIPDGTTVNIVIAGAVRFKGHAGSKGDRDNCMSVGDFVVVDGAQASAKMSGAAAKRVQVIFEKFEKKVAGNFFSFVTAAAGAAGDEEGDDIDWDRSEEAAADAVAAAVARERLGIEDETEGNEVDIDAI